MSWEAIIGLEVHAQLLTQTKMFCRCPTRFGEEPNTQVCPVCLGLPGSLPVPNREAIAMALKTAHALRCTIHQTSVFARKNYFYPDLPKNYQISQYDRPLATDGALDIEINGTQKTIGIERLHLEEDAGKSLHEGFPDSQKYTYLDFNRAGTPLIEIVSKPDIETPEEAALYLKTLRQILLYLGVCDGNMEQGSFRCDANVSVRKKGEPFPSYKVELKNLNSFRFVQKALEYEIKRQIKMLEAGEILTQETRTWDERAQKTRVMRTKEEAQDYRYFPDPDLLPLKLDEKWIKRVCSTVGELPAERKARFIRQYELTAYDASLLTANPRVSEYFEKAVQHVSSPKRVANWLTSELFRYFDFETGEPPETVPPEHLGELVRLVEEKKLTGSLAKDVLEDMIQTGKSAQTIVKEKGLEVVADPETLRRIIRDILDNHADKVEAYRKGRTKLFGFFMGQVMKATRGKADPQTVQTLLKEMLSSE